MLPRDFDAFLPVGSTTCPRQMTLQNSYRNVICLGHVVDPTGKKASKSRGNVLDPNYLFDTFGSDAVRWYFYTSTQVGENYRTGDAVLKETVQQFFIPLWNCYSFFVTYARLDTFDPALAQALLEVAVRPRQARRLPDPLRGAAHGLDADGAVRAIHRGRDVPQPFGGQVGPPRRLSASGDRPRSPGRGGYAAGQAGGRGRPRRTRRGAAEGQAAAREDRPARRRIAGRHRRDRPRRAEREGGCFRRAAGRARHRDHRGVEARGPGARARAHHPGPPQEAWPQRRGPDRHSLRRGWHDPSSDRPPLRLHQDRNPVRDARTRPARRI